MTRKNLGAFERATRVVLGLVFVYAAWKLFKHPVAQTLSAAFGLYSFFEATSGFCPLLKRLGADKPSDILRPEQSRLLTLAAVQMVLAYEWYATGMEKLLAGDFIANMPKSLAAFAGNNPHLWYQNILNSYIVERAALFGYLVEWGEAFAGLGLVLGMAWYIFASSAKQKRMALILSIASLVGGALMNANFYFAAGWLSPSTHGVNLVMLWASLALIYGWISEYRASLK